MKKHFLYIFLIFVSLPAFTQRNQDSLATTPVDFLTQVKSDLSELKTEKGEAVSLFFQKFWQDPNTYSTTSKNKIEALYDSLLTRKLNVRDYRLPFISAISAAVANLENPSATIETFLIIVERGLSELEIQQFGKLIKNAESILGNKALYYSKFYQLGFDKGNVIFDWVVNETMNIPEAVEEEAEEEWSDNSSDASDDWGDDDAWGDSSWEDEASEESSDVASEESQQPAYVPYSAPMPDLVGPIVVFTNSEIKFQSTLDTTRIKNTSGKLELLGNTFVGEGGKLTWQNLGVPENELYAELPEYSIKINKPGLLVESATLHYPDKIRQPVKGLLEFKPENIRNKEKARYPLFQSYESGFDLNLFKKEGLSIRGGFTLRGKTITTASLNNDFSQVELQGKAVKKFLANSREFVFRDSAFTAKVANISMYQRRDSIYHPGVKFKYDVRDNSLTLLQGNDGFKKSPFHASYFKMDFYADKIEWPLDSAIMDISILIAGNRVPAIFESSEYFNEYRYNSLSGLYNFHPLQLVVAYSRKARQKTFYLNEVADKMNIDENKLAASMQLLMENGFLIYNRRSGKIDMLKKSYHYVDSKWGKKDYDNIKINSVSSGQPNGQLNLEDGSLTLRGVEEFEVNEKLGVRIKPDSGIVVLKKNRDVIFNGTVVAGNYEYIGEEFEMDYDSFLISMPKIDRILFNLSKNKNKPSQSDKEQLQNQLVETAGVLYINKPDNKSATRDFPGYPIFNSTKGATVYFLGQEILGGVYDKSLYFEIPPFTIDSVSSSDPNSIAFEGTFKSSGIFPEFDEKLKVMPDKSLGFNHPLPEEGIDLLEGMGRFYGSIKLDNKGLRGGDKMEFLSTTLNSENFTFFKDSITAIGTYAKMEPGTIGGASFPDMEIVNYDMRWLTSKDSLYLSNVSDPFKMYSQTASLNGKTIISTNGVYGEGELATRGSKTTSKKYTFNELSYSARNADFIIESTDTIPALASDNVKLNFDLSNNTASINPEIAGDAALNFPYASYKTSIPSAIWNLEDKQILMQKSANDELEKSYFYSTNPDQDSLVFNATAAMYDIYQQSLIVSGIPFIEVADARITPAEGEVVIGANAAMQKLINATLTLDTLTAYHSLYDGEIDIISRKKFEGDATYSYVNSIGDTFSIKMGKFKLVPLLAEDKKKQQLRTVSGGAVSTDDRMLISPAMYYKGSVTMYADKPALDLKGYVQLDLKNIPNYNTWISYTSDGSAKEVVFDFDNSVTEMGNPLQAGLHFDNATNELYATFITEKRDFADKDFFKPSGLLRYKPSTSQFVIENENKSLGLSYAGKYFAFNEQDQKIEFEGPLNFMEGNKEAQIVAAGSGSGDLATQDFVFNVMLTTEFDLPGALTPVIGNDMLEVVQRLGLPEATKDLDRLLPKMAEIAGNNVAKKYEENVFNDYVPLTGLSSSFTKTLTIPNLDLKWSNENSAWFSVGKIGFSNTGSTDVNANIDGFVEIDKKDVGTSLKIFLQVSPSCWYYFHYEENRLIFYSSNAAANDIIDKKSKATKAKVGEFVFLTGDKLEVTDFIENYRRTYYDIDAPYFLEMGSEASSALAIPANTDPLPETSTPVLPADDDDGF